MVGWASFPVDPKRIFSAYTSALITHFLPAGGTWVLNIPYRAESGGMSTILDYGPVN